jgi:hypothetical protein
MLRSDQCANLRLRPKLHSTPPPGIMTPETCRPRCCSNAGRDDTSWKQRLSSIMANRPDNQSSSAPAVATTREGLIRHDKSASGLSAMRRSIWTGLRLPGFLIVRNTNLTGRSPKLRRSCPTSGDSRPNAFANDDPFDAAHERTRESLRCRSVSTALRWPSYSIDVSDATTPRLWQPLLGEP